MKFRIAILALLAFSLTSCLKTKTDGVEVLNAVKFEQKMQAADVQLVDVRTPEEFAEGHLPNAININVTGDSFDAETAKLDKEKPVMVYCKMGGRSAKAASNLKEQGFKNISDLDGGITSWNDAGKLIEQ
ncbi:rhodanese-like domain-containing protein [Flavobacterium sp.]|jgi:rhodanese-related sulfurtransferase|uniref:rhodanese-like domain-containing protein n=1 Tax=Flavobacterium sp. TaxID=239 RepID=UPI002A8233CD|nr:rhodanese-like domain-containing protein [Flavobacterium sp.]